MVQWEKLKLFIFTHLGISRSDFLEIYNKPVLVQQKRRGVPVKELLKKEEAKVKIIPLAEWERERLVQFEGAKDIEDLFLFLPFDKGDSIYIGRDQENDIPLNVPWVSSRHARISRNHMGLYIIEDLHSEEGTFLNEKKLFPGVEYPLSDFCQIVFGRYIKYFFLTPEGLYEYLQLFA